MIDLFKSPTMKMIKKYLKVETLIFFSFLLLSGAACIYWGRQGISVWDFSYVVEPSYRMSLGQIPYKDFWIIPLPLTFFIQSILYRIFGASLYVSLSYLMVIDALVALCIYKILRQFLSFGNAFLFAALNVLWFGLPFGFPFYDLDAYFFLILALTFAIQTKIKPQNLQAKDFLLGMLVGISFLSKQNIGIGGFLLIPLMVFVAEGVAIATQRLLRRSVLYISGFLLPLVVFILITFIQGNFYEMVRWTLERASVSKGGVFSIVVRIVENTLSSFTTIGLPHGPYVMAALTNTLLFLLALILFLSLPRREKKDILALALLGFVFLLILFQRLSIPNAMFRFNGFFVGGSLGILVYFCYRLYPRKGKYFATSIFVIYLFIGIITSERRLDNAWLGDEYSRTTNEYALQSRGLEGFQLSKEFGSGIDELIGYVRNNLKDAEDTFIVFPLDPFVHFSTGKVPVQPAVQFFPEKQFFAEDQEAYIHVFLPKIRWIFQVKHYQEEYRDELIVDDFYLDLPLLTEAMHREYSLVGELQNYAIYRRNES